MVLLLAMAGCGGSPIDADTDGVPPAQATGTLRVLMPSYPASNEGKAAFAKVAERFNRIYPKMKVEPDYATYSNLNEKISTSIAAGIPYDVMVVGVGWVPPFAAKRIFADLSQFGVDGPALKKRTVPALAPTAMYDGNVYGIPLVADARAMALRKSAFRDAGLDPDDPPQTMAELKTAAEKLTRRNKAGTITRPGFDFHPGDGGSYRQIYLTLLKATGTSLYRGTEPNFDNPKGVQTLNWIKSMIGPTQVYGQVTASEDPMVYTGDAAMGVTGGAIDCSADGLGAENCDDMEYFLPDDGEPSEFVGGDIAAVGTRSKHSEAAWAFIQQLTQKGSLDELAELNQKLPAYADVQDSPQAKSNPLSHYLAAHLNDVAYEGGPVNWLDLRPKFDAKLSQAILGQKPSEDVLAELAEQSQSTVGGN
ncbi:extracellular solute-binding protein [Microlunatus soli]|uniref:Carbohydrate ABC transporter substrate-binding protein, CUT1 family n=1 Tax=Microlunatus soli TaxID=630515 RepID=A0A1H1Y6C5_9ACTN|nr:extracellular solute-binding protein [Microlunatus soli]SDT16977.1 carbohydrate ABC transporter substrate-binding protein, CUT1 family [Microlunatus soli]